MSLNVSGFRNAPFTKASMLLVGASTVASRMTRSIARWKLVPLRDSPRLWTLITSHLPFASAGEALFGLILLYQFRHFERAMGSRKFSSLSLLSAAISTTMQLAATAIFSGFTAGRLAPGPYAMVMTGMVLYFSEVPAAMPVTICGVRVSDKILTYLAGLQLIFADSSASLVTATCSLAAGFLVTSDALPLRNFRLPQPLCTAARAIFGGVLDYPPGPLRAQLGAGQHMNRDDFVGVGAGAGAGAGGMDAGAWRQPDAPFANQFPAPAYEPSEGDIASLEAMGFPRDRVIAALRETGNVQEAADRMLQ